MNSKIKPGDIVHHRDKRYGIVIELAPKVPRNKYWDTQVFWTVEWLDLGVIDSLKQDRFGFSMSSADDVNASAMTSTTLAVSLASNPKPLTVAPATIAALPKSDCVAVASNNVASCASNISCVER